MRLSNLLEIAHLYWVDVTVILASAARRWLS